jgi:hypothetical protein
MFKVLKRRLAPLETEGLFIEATVYALRLIC